MTTKPRKPVVGYTFRFDSATPTIAPLECVACKQTLMGYPRTTLTRTGETRPAVAAGKCVACEGSGK